MTDALYAPLRESPQSCPPGMCAKLASCPDKHCEGHPANALYLDYIESADAPADAWAWLDSLKPAASYAALVIAVLVALALILWRYF
jgi:hypothetical protein